MAFLMSKHTLLFTMLSCCVLCLVACKSEVEELSGPVVEIKAEPKQDNDEPATAPANDATTTAEPQEKKAEPAAAGDSATGIPACDEYLNKYQACLELKVPEGARGAMSDAFKAQRDAWRQSAAAAKDNKAMLEQLSKNCTEALAAAKAPMQQYGCEW